MSAKENAIWANIIIDSFLEQNIEHFVLSPGSRSTALAIAVASNKKAISFLHFDERGAAYFALGIIKNLKKPVVMICTSGTAVGNLLPAAMEADQQNLPLILLTADRPPELIDNGSNQTTFQKGVFSNFIRWQHEIATPSEEIETSYLSSIISYAVKQSYDGPIHLNVPFREPLSSLQQYEIPITQTICYEPFLKVLSQNTLQKWKHLLCHKGVIVLGEGAAANSEEALKIKNLSDKLGYPILADITSNYRCFPKQSSISYYLSIIQSTKISKPNVILHIGGRIVSKIMQEWLKNLQPCTYLHVMESKKHFDPLFKIKEKLEISTLDFCNQLEAYLTPSSDNSYLYEWEEREKEVSLLIGEFFKNTKDLTEPYFIKFLSNELKGNVNLFCANSMPIREADSFFYPQEAGIRFFSLRGVSGIDGNIATTVGIAATSSYPTIAIIGDLAALHDLNSLALLSNSKKPIVFFILNNKGGGIFSYLPVAKHAPNFDRFFTTSHNFEFEHAAKMFGLSYFNVTKSSELPKLLQRLKTLDQHVLIEVNTSREQNLHFHKELKCFMEEAFCSFAKR